MSPSGTTMHYKTAAHGTAELPGAALRLRVWRRQPELDEALARGADAGDSPELGLRARQLASPKHRVRLAREIERLVSLADRAPGPPGGEARLAGTVLPVRRAEVRGSRSLLLRLAQRLRDDRPADPQGLAQTWRLLRDSASPLYVDSGPRGAQYAVLAVLSNLDRASLRFAWGSDAEASSAAA
jgi:hypothetical protein